MGRRASGPCCGSGRRDCCLRRGRTHSTARLTLGSPVLNVTELRLLGRMDEQLGTMHVTPPVLQPPAGLASRLRGSTIEWKLPGRELYGDDRPGVDSFVGSVPVISGAVHGRRLGLSFLEVPPPPPFTTDDVETMWAAACSAPGPAPASVLGPGLSPCARNGRSQRHPTTRPARVSGSV